ncbi:hypothetical protein P3L10_000429 [Capsicum annuum]
MLSNVLISKDMVNLEEGREDGEQKNLVRWEPILEERRKSRENGSSSQQDFSETLLDHNFTNDRIHQLFMELLSAGSDAITSKIEWAIAELIKNVDSMKKVQEELEIELSDSDYPKESQLLQMSYV